MKTIVLFGAGKSATVLIDHLKELATENKINVIVADSDLKLAQSKVGWHKLVIAVQVDITNEAERKQLIKQADIVISLMPPALHHLIALDCIEFSKHLLTASYVSNEIKDLQRDIAAKGILFLCEMGLDPGIDHMSAMKLIDEIKNTGGEITSFKSHCGGLVAPESDNNPWHYKISWNPRNVVLAGKAGAVYKENGSEIHKSYEELFTNNACIDLPELGKLAYYPNRDSLSYISVYGLESAQTFLRTTLRYPEFCRGWKNIIDLKLTDEEIKYDITGMTIMSFFDIHLQTQKLDHVLDKMDEIMKYYAAEMLVEKEKQQIKEDDDHLFVNEEGSLDSISKYAEVDEAKPASIKFHEAQMGIAQLFYLGLINDKTPINPGFCSPADVLQFIIEKKLALKKRDKDMIVMMHEIEYKIEGKKHEIKSTLVVKGENNLHTAMAKTVGLPLGIAAKLILEGKIKETGLHIPIIPSIYKPVLHELEKHGVIFNEEKK